MDELDDFTWKQWGGKKVDVKDYSSKKLEIAMQDIKITAEQRRWDRNGQRVCKRKKD